MANLLKISRKNKHLPLEEKKALLITEMRSTLSTYERQIFDMLINRPVGVLEISFALCINDPRGHISIMGRKKGIPSKEDGFTLLMANDIKNIGLN